MRNGRLRLALLAGTALGLTAAPAIAATQIGVTAAVNPAAAGTPPAQETRVLRVGTDMVANERVETGPRGQAQLLFLDGSALTVGPNSTIALDEFVYDPDTKSGKLAFSATKGVFRLVGGSLSKRTPVSIKTPTATIGVRGGIAVVEAGEDGVNATFLFGDQMSVTSGGQTQTATRPGFSIQAPAGGPPNPPQPASDQQIGQSLNQFEGGDGQNGGADVPPTDEDVAQSQIANQNSVQANLPAAGGPPPSGGVPPDPQGEVVDASQNEMSNLVPPPPGGGDTPGNGDTPGGDGPTDPGPQGVNISGLSGRFKIGSAGQGTEDGDSQLDVAFSNASVTESIFSGAGLTLPAQDGSFSVPLTALPTFDGIEYAGTGWLSPGQDFLIYELEDPIDFQRLLGFAGKPTPAAAIPTTGFTAYSFRRDFVLDSDVPFVLTGGVGYSSAAPAKGYIDWSTRAFVMNKIVLEGQGPSQRSAASVFVGRAVNLGDPMTADINGRFRGSASVDPQFGTPRIFENGSGDGFELQRGGDGAGFFGSSGPDYFVLGNGDGIATQSGGTSYAPNAVAQKTTGSQTTRTSATLTGFVGGLAQENGSQQRTFRIANSDPANFQFTTNASNGTLSGSLSLDDQGNPGYGDLQTAFGGTAVGESAFFDDDTFAATEAATPAIRQGESTGDRSFFMTTADGLELIGALPPGVSLCNCQYLRWGVLGLDFGDPQTPGDRTRVELAGWVAGQLSAQVDLPAIGLATYSGHVFGNVLNGSDFYSAVGGLTVTFNFGAPTSSTVNITNFDGASYTANVSNLAANGIYNGNATSGGRFLTYKAAFFAGGGNPAAETGGQFTITGTAYSAGGVMVGAQTSFDAGS